MSGKTIEICKENTPNISGMLRQFSECEPGFAHTAEGILMAAHDAELRLVYAGISEADSVGAVAIAVRACPSDFEERWGYGSEVQMIRSEKSWEISKIGLCKIRHGSKEKLEVSIKESALHKETKPMLRGLGVKILRYSA